MMEHTKEPWSLCEAGDYIYINESGGAGYICNLIIHPHRADEICANARRIVAAVNACAGISTDDLEQFGRWISSGEVEWVKQQRDELLAALERLTFAAQCRDNTVGDPCRLIEVKAELSAAAEQGRAAIASVKGGA